MWVILKCTVAQTEAGENMGKAWESRAKEKTDQQAEQNKEQHMEADINNKLGYFNKASEPEWANNTIFHVVYYFSYYIYWNS